MQQIVAIFWGGALVVDYMQPEGCVIHQIQILDVRG